MKTREDFKFAEEYDTYLNHCKRRRVLIDNIHTAFTNDFGFTCEVRVVGDLEFRDYTLNTNVVRVEIDSDLNIILWERLDDQSITELLSNIEKTFGTMDLST